MIVKHHDNFFIQWDIVYPIANGLNLGIFNFWINDKAYPAEATNITLGGLMHELTANIPAIENLKTDIGDLPIEEIDFSDFENENLIWFDTDQLFQYCFAIVLGFNKDEERLFYSTDFEKSYHEITLPKGVVLATLLDLQKILL
ncbi:hypothetical protein HXZ94_07345 [Empedobacter falsenii]|uniref:Imm42 family immunity protein n=1 Tax=Empedobacter falsenii TaxID=343874 RepID=UPI0025773A04|nr:Imm42 family immunity protein [Empedobacter falsenii]MDM1298315.1 hypothetical protein [Empedobacter falsenii]MDM1318128.1 hypothetical protein [Empedobacter falsenii]